MRAAVFLADRHCERAAAALSLALSLTLCFIFAPAARADAPQEVAALIKSGKLDEARQRADTFLATKPKDAQMRFLKGVVLAEQGKKKEAIDLFTLLTQDFPELPEPWNNLAALYASEGQYDKARAALETAIRTDPGYGVAYENLGDVYARLAGQSYEKAKKFDTGNTATQKKLTLIRDLLANVDGKRSATTSPARTTAAAAPAPVKSNVGLPIPSGAPAVVAGVGATPPEVVARTSTPKKNEAAAAEPTPGSPLAASGALPLVAPGRAGNELDLARPIADVTAVVNAWAAARSGNDADAYFSFYAKDFEGGPRIASRAKWEAAQRAQFASKKKRTTTLADLKVRVDGDGATARFREEDRIGETRTTSRKVLSLINRDGKWLIREERLGV